MHLIEGKPATYQHGTQVCFLGNGSVLNLCNSLSELRRQQKSSLNWRLARNLEDRKEDYGYLRIRTND